MSAHHADAVDKAVAALRYGSVNINVVTMLGFCVPKLTWGAYPGSTPQARPWSPALCASCSLPYSAQLCLSPFADISAAGQLP